MVNPIIQTGSTIYLGDILGLFLNGGSVSGTSLVLTQGTTQVTIPGLPSGGGAVVTGGTILNNGTIEIFQSNGSTAAIPGNVGTTFPQQFTQYNISAGITVAASGSTNYHIYTPISSTDDLIINYLQLSATTYAAPLTSPAMSTNSTTAGMVLADLLNCESFQSLSSGTGTMPTDGSIVQKR